MKRIFATLIFAVISMTLFAQSFTLQGRVTDQENNPVELASVVSQGKLTMTNLNGEFSMQLQSADSVEVRFSMIGYKTKTRVLRRPRGNQKLQVQLQPMEALQEVVVTADEQHAIGLRQQGGRTDSAAGRRKHS